MEFEKSNKSFCEKLFGGGLDVTEEPGIKMSQARQYKYIMMQNAEKERKVTKKMFLTLKGMKSFSKAKKNMLICYISIRDGIAEALTEMEELCKISDVGCENELEMAASPGHGT